jgi:hypothetical protein
MSEHTISGGSDPGICCGHEAELARVISLCTHAVAGDCLEAAVRRELSYLSSELLLAQKELAALRAALVVAENRWDSAKACIVDVESALTNHAILLTRVVEARQAIARFHAARKVGK